MADNKLKIVFIGTPEFGKIILQKLIEAKYQPALVITETDKPAGRKRVLLCPPVKTLCQECQIPVIQPDAIAKCAQKIKDLKPDLGIIAAYGQLIPKNILSVPKFGFINVHPSLLPKYRGPSPIQSAILKGDAQTGVTILLLDDKMDHGPILASRKLQITNYKITYRALHDKLAEFGAELLLETIDSWTEGKIKPSPQDEKMATYTKILSKKDGKIDWKKSAIELERQVRAFDPWPGSFTEFDDNGKVKLLKIWRARAQKQTETGPVGEPGKTFMATNEEIAVQTGKDYLIIEELQLGGGKRMASSDFLKGNSDFIGTTLR